VGGKLHVTGMIVKNSIGVSGTIIEELGDSLGSGFHALRLSKCNGAKGNEHGGVNGMCIVEEGANNFLDLGQVSMWEAGSSVGRRSELGWSTIVRRIPCVMGNAEAKMVAGAGIY
jgi:hypothetical protein